MKKDIIKALPIKEWGTAGDPFEYAEERGRTVLTIGIGTRKDPNNSDTTYITEPIYEDIVQEIINVDSKYKIDVDVYAVPQVVVTLDNKLVIHSEPVKLLKMNTLFVIKDTAMELKIKALRDIRLNQDAKTKLGDSIRAIRSIIKDATDYNYNLKFIECLLKEEYIETFATPDENSELEQVIHALNNQELISAIAGIAEMKVRKKCSIEPLKTLLESVEAPTEVLEKIINTEVAQRYFIGEIK